MEGTVLFECRAHVCHPFRQPATGMGFEYHANHIFCVSLHRPSRSVRMRTITAILFVCLIVVCGPTHVHASSRPNIVLILADDYGVGEVSCYGADHYKTPNIDALARGGIRFTHAYTAALCGPSRAMLMTGRYAFRTGATNQDATGRMTPENETMIPQVLKSAGYVSSCVGKWGQLPLGPGNFGFDDYLKIRGSGAYWNTQPNKGTYVVNGKSIPLGDNVYLPDVMHEHAVKFMQQHVNEPFFLYYSLSHVHAQILPTPDSVKNSTTLYADNVEYMDKLVGKLVTELERLGLREKTLVVFMGDNGTANTRATRATIGGRPLAGAKGSMMEGGGLVPLIVNWPGVTPANRVADNMIDASDLLPTFASVAGAPLPANRIIDGISFASQLRGEKSSPRAWAFNQLARQWYVREPGWKLNQSGELFDMSNAPFHETRVPTETKNAAAIASRKRLQAALDQLSPGSGFVDDGDGTGRHASRKKDTNANED